VRCRAGVVLARESRDDGAWCDLSQLVRTVSRDVTRGNRVALLDGDPRRALQRTLIGSHGRSEMREFESEIAFWQIGGG